MSQKNKQYRKKTRCAERAIEGEIVRTRVSAFVPAAIATKILTNPKYKVNARLRRKLSLRRGVVVETPRTDAKHPAVKLVVRLTKLSLATLYRRLKQSARKAATAKEILSELSEGSQFAAGVAAEQTRQLSILKQVKAEIFSRR